VVLDCLADGTVEADIVAGYRTLTGGDPCGRRLRRRLGPRGDGLASRPVRFKLDENIDMPVVATPSMI